MQNHSKYLNTAAVILSVLFIAGCNMSEPNIDITNKGTVLEKTASTDTIYAGNRDTLLLLNDGEAFVKGRIIAGKISPQYTIPTWKGQEVMAYLSPEIKGGNICINRVDSPGSEPNGPYDDSVHLSMESSGNLRLKIGGNLKGGHPYTGNFVLHIIVK